ncbi:MAG: dTDP-4-dehydrorhamnose reductase [Nitrospinae bacterium]|nr:dTDP-4-dehydrorhamnose reductase [Nitrospinota bacterium]
MKIVVTGANGGLGGAIISACARLYPSWECVGLTRAEADLADAVATEKAVSSLAPDVIIHCSAMTAVERCETEPDLARRINVDGTRAVARSAEKCGARMVFVSTDYVFDGSGAPYQEDATPAPLNVYGQTKLEGERAMLVLNRSLVVRTSWLYGKNGKSFPATVLGLAKTKKVIRMVNDQKGSPTYSADLAEALLKLVEMEATGIYHVCNSGHCTWYELAKAVLEIRGINAPLEPTSSSEFNAPAKRPADSRLDCSRYAEKTGSPLRPWREALADYLSSLPA